LEAVADSELFEIFLINCHLLYLCNHMKILLSEPYVECMSSVMVPVCRVLDTMDCSKLTLVDRLEDMKMKVYEKYVQ
jgi:hypothetical protein